MTKVVSWVLAPLAALSINAIAQGAQQSPSEPQLFAPGVVSTQDFEYDLSLSPDGQTALFTRGDPGYNRLTILEAHRERGRWTRAEVAPFSGVWKDADAHFSPDGRKIWFISTRPVSGSGEPRNDYDIWFVERQASGAWGSPQHLDGPVNTDGNEAFPSLTHDGTLYFEAARKEHPGTHIYRSRLINGQYGEPELLSFSTQANDINPAVAADGSFIVFASRDRGGVGGSDLFITFARPDGSWSAPKNLGEPINSKFAESSPGLSPDNRVLYFSSNRVAQPLVRQQRATAATLERELRGPQNGLLDIYEAPLGDLHRFQGS